MKFVATSRFFNIFLMVSAHILRGGKINRECLNCITKQFYDILKKIAMKNRELSILTNLLSLVALFLLCSSFTIMTNGHATVSAETKQSFWAAIQGFSVEKLSFWQKTALYLGTSSAVVAIARPHYRRHYEGGGGLGCLGVLGIIVLGAIVIALLPLLLVVGLVMLILGIPFTIFGGRGRRHRRYRRERY